MSGRGARGFLSPPRAEWRESGCAPSRAGKAPEPGEIRRRRWGVLTIGEPTPSSRALARSDTSLICMGRRRLRDIVRDLRNFSTQYNFRICHPLRCATCNDALQTRDPLPGIESVAPWVPHLRSNIGMLPRPRMRPVYGLRAFARGACGMTIERF